MPRQQWPLRRGRPCVEVVLTLAAGGQPFPRIVVADSGAGASTSGIHLILEVGDCLLCGGTPLQPITLGGAYTGSFPTYGVSVRVPALGFHQNLRAVGVPAVRAGFDGLACFSFLNRFTYGNFGNPSLFGLEC
jgi:hypothetical protein